MYNYYIFQIGLSEQDMKLTFNLSLTSTQRIHGALPPISHRVLCCGSSVTTPVTP